MIYDHMTHLIISTSSSNFGSRLPIVSHSGQSTKVVTEGDDGWAQPIPLHLQLVSDVVSSLPSDYAHSIRVRDWLVFEEGLLASSRPFTNRIYK